MLHRYRGLWLLFLILTGMLLVTAAAHANSPAQPGLAGSWTKSFDAEFNGTKIDTALWNLRTGYDSGNGATWSTANDTASGGYANLIAASATSEGEIQSKYQLPVGGVLEVRAYFPGGSPYVWDVYNWPAVWTSGNNWPANGENDIAEGNVALCVNYHGPGGAQNFGSPAGNWPNGWHVYELYRQSLTHDEVIYDGQVVESYAVNDQGGGQNIILSDGPGQGPAMYGGINGELRVDWAAAWTPTTKRKA